MSSNDSQNSSAIPPLTTFPGKKIPPPPPSTSTSSFSATTGLFGTTTSSSSSSQNRPRVSETSGAAYAHLMTAPKNDNANQNANAVASPQLPGARKCILSEGMMGHFKSLRCYKNLISFIADLSISVLGEDCRPVEIWKYQQQQQQQEKTSDEGNTTTTAVTQDGEQTSSFEVPRCDIAVNRSSRKEQDQYQYATPLTPVFIDFFTELHQWISDIPLETLMKSRFGNLAFRSFQAKLRETGAAWIEKIVSASPNATTSVSDDLIQSVAEELLPYLFDAFGNAVRIDFGTGHELHFLIILYILHMNGLLVGSNNNTNNNETEVLRETVLVVLDEYWRLMSRIQQHYRLEPAGSHGVWGLDDFHHLPFILGAAQFSPKESWHKDNLQGPSSMSSTAMIPSAPLPSEIPSKKSCEEIAPRNFFFRAVLNIHKTKSGPFGEHSGVLQSVSGLGSWPRVLTGMIKMFEGEVLGKFLIVQHLLFGKTFKWEQ